MRRGDRDRHARRDDHVRTRKAASTCRGQARGMSDLGPPGALMASHACRGCLSSGLQGHQRPVLVTRHWDSWEHGEHGFCGSSPVPGASTRWRWRERRGAETCGIAEFSGGMGSTPMWAHAGAHSVTDRSSLRGQDGHRLRCGQAARLWGGVRGPGVRLECWCPLSWTLALGPWPRSALCSPPRVHARLLQAL